MMRIGILGGTFDPPHVGHLILGEYAVEALNLRQLLLVPAADPPHKQNEAKTPIMHRLGMLERAIAGNSRFVMSRVDIDRPGPHYSIDTVRIVQSQYPDSELYFVMGGDSLRDLPKWHHPEILIERCKLAVMQRPGYDIEADKVSAILPGLMQRVVMIDAPRLEISSTDIVRRLQQGKSVRYVLPDAVLEYIRENQIYA